MTGTNPVASLAALLTESGHADVYDATAFAEWLLARGVQYAPRDYKSVSQVMREHGYEDKQDSQFHMDDVAAAPFADDYPAAPPREPPPLGDELFKRVRRALWTYCQHKRFCHYVEPEYDDDSLVNEGTPCDCGLHAEMEASQGARGRPEGPHPELPTKLYVVEHCLARAVEELKRPQGEWRWDELQLVEGALLELREAMGRAAVLPPGEGPDA